MSSQQRRWGLAPKLGLLVLIGSATMFVAAYGVSYVRAREVLLQNAEQIAGHLTQATVNRIEAVLTRVESPALFLGSWLETHAPPEAELLALIRSAVATSPSAFGSAVAFEPDLGQPQRQYYAPYCYRKGDQIHTDWLGSKEYHYFSYDWYMIPKQLGHPVWSEPYFDEGGGNALLVTYSVPFSRVLDGERRFVGVVTADVSLDWLVTLVSSVSLFRSGHAFLVSQNGVFVTHPDRGLIMRESIFSLAEAAGDARMRKIGQDMVHGGSGFVRLHSSCLGRDAWLYYAPLPSLGWSLGILLPNEELFADLQALTRDVTMVGGFGFTGLLLVIFLISTGVTRPIRALARTAGEIARGNLDVSLPTVRSHDEVGDLSVAFDDMRSALKEYISNLTATTAAKERIESELKIAHTIQMSFLPKRFPPFPQRDEFDLFAVLEPAKEVGGDLYDFFLLDEDRLFFSIGDVSGKGVPAALFMAVTKTLMKGIGTQGDLGPGQILGAVNVELCRDNDMAMFVTVFCGIMDLRTGEIEFANAGHNPPVVLRQGGLPHWLEVPPGVVLGVMEDAVYPTARTVLKPRELILLYTDGVTEAMNGEEELFSAERLLTTLARPAPVPEPVTIVEDVLGAVKGYVGDTPQSDDITLLALKYAGSSVHGARR